MNQVPNLLEEELALLRGRDDTLEPSVDTSPDLQPADLELHRGASTAARRPTPTTTTFAARRTNTVGIITAEDAKRLYPAGPRRRLGPLPERHRPLLRPALATPTSAGTPSRRPRSSATPPSAPTSSTSRSSPRPPPPGPRRRRDRQPDVPPALLRGPDRTLAGLHATATPTAPGASAAGPAAPARPRYYDWVVANSLLLDRLTNMAQVGGADQPPEGIQRIDRDHGAGARRDRRQPGRHPDPGGQRRPRPEPARPGPQRRALRHHPDRHRRRPDALRADLRPRGPGPVQRVRRLRLRARRTLDMREQFDSVYDLQEHPRRERDRLPQPPDRNLRLSLPGRHRAPARPIRRATRGRT